MNLENILKEFITKRAVRSYDYDFRTNYCDICNENPVKIYLSERSIGSRYYTIDRLCKKHEYYYKHFNRIEIKPEDLERVKIYNMKAEFVSELNSILRQGLSLFGSEELENIVKSEINNLIIKDIIE